MTSEQVVGLLLQSVGIAVVASILTQLLKPAFNKIKDIDTKHIVINGTTLFLSFGTAIVISVYNGWDTQPSVWAELILLTIFGTGLAIGGYEGVSNILNKVTAGSSEKRNDPNG